MAAKNDITGDLIKTKASSSEAYSSGWDRIFKSKQRYLCPVCNAGGAHPSDAEAPFCHVCTDRVKMKKANNDTIIE